MGDFVALRFGQRHFQLVSSRFLLGHVVVSRKYVCRTVCQGDELTLDTSRRPAFGKLPKMGMTSLLDNAQKLDHGTVDGALDWDSKWNPVIERLWAQAARKGTKRKREATEVSKRLNALDIRDDLVGKMSAMLVQRLGVVVDRHAGMARLVSVSHCGYRLSRKAQARGGRASPTDATPARCASAWWTSERTRARAMGEGVAVRERAGRACDAGRRRGGRWSWGAGGAPCCPECCAARWRVVRERRGSVGVAVAGSGRC